MQQIQMVVKQVDEEAVAQDMVAVLGEVVVLQEQHNDLEHRQACNIIYSYMVVCSFSHFYLYIYHIHILLFISGYSYFVIHTCLIYLIIISYSFLLYSIASYFLLLIDVAMKWKENPICATS